MPKNTYMTHRKPVLMHGFHSMPQVGIQQVSLKAYRRWASTCHRMMTIAQINELLDLFDLGHCDSAMAIPRIYVHGQRIMFLVNFGN